MLALRICTFTIVALTTAFAFFSSQFQQAKTEQPDPIARLLEMPAPVSAPAKKEVEPWEEQRHVPVPKDDAPLKHLIKFYSQLLPSTYVPSEVISRRLLEAVEQNPDLLPTL